MYVLVCLVALCFHLFSRGTVTVEEVTDKMEGTATGGATAGRCFA